LSPCFLFPYPFAASYHRWPQVPANASAPVEIWASGFSLVLGLANDPALPGIIYAAGKLQANASHAPAEHENVVVEIDIQKRNSWNVVATLHNNVSRVP
jgi:hypothetical protein